ncbi:hypothetical protein K525DRAFT_226557, partial [Schizophyllum commune Loenen D]
MLPTHANESTPLYSPKPERPSSFNWLSAIKYLCFAVPAVILICTSWPRTTPAEPEIYWDVPLVPETDCLGYGTRAYSAKLNIVASATKNWHKICMGEAPEVEVTGRILEKPAWCDMGINQTVVGHWIVDFDEPECISSWGQFDDKGCTTEASGFRRPMRLPSSAALTLAPGATCAGAHPPSYTAPSSRAQCAAITRRANVSMAPGTSRTRRARR